MSYLPPSIPRDIVKRSKRAVVTHLFFDDPPPGRREMLASMVDNIGRTRESEKRYQRKVRQREREAAK